MPDRTVDLSRLSIEQAQAWNDVKDHVSDDAMTPATITNDGTYCAAIVCDWAAVNELRYQLLDAIDAEIDADPTNAALSSYAATCAGLWALVKTAYDAQKEF